MARFLFVVPPFAGHVNPTIPVAAELVSRGHEVAWAGLPGQRGAQQLVQVACRVKRGQFSIDASTSHKKYAVDVCTHCHQAGQQGIGGIIFTTRSK